MIKETNELAYWANHFAFMADEASEQARTIDRKRKEHIRRGKGDFRLSKKDREDQITIDQLAAILRNLKAAAAKHLNAAETGILRSHAAKYRGPIV